MPPADTRSPKDAGLLVPAISGCPQIRRPSGDVPTGAAAICEVVVAHSLVPLAGESAGAPNGSNQLPACFKEDITASRTQAGQRAASAGGEAARTRPRAAFGLHRTNPP